MTIDLFQQLGEQEITKSVLKAIWDNDIARKTFAEDKLSLYKDDYEDIIRAKMKELFHKDNYGRLYYHVNQSQNILKRVIDTISMIYKEPTVRTTTDTRYKEILEAFDFDVFMKRNNRYTNLFNECLIYVGVRFNQLVYDIITPNNASVIQNLKDPTIADAIYYQVSRVNTAKRGKNEDIINYYYWDVAGNAYILNQNWEVVEVIYDAEGEGLKGQTGVTPSPYLDEEFNKNKRKTEDIKYLLPFVTLHRQFPDTDFWDTTSGQDLYNSTVLTGVKFTQFDYHFKYAAFKQMYAVGDKVEVPVGQIMDAPSMIWVKGEGASVGTLDTAAKLDQMEAALIFQINSVINNYGISSDAWTLSVAEASGRALKIRNQALIESRQDQLSTYIQGEKDLFDLIKVVNNAHAGFYKWGTIGDGAEVVTDFGEIGFPEDPQVELKLDVKKLRAGIITPGQFYMKYNPDFTDEKKAETQLVKNLEKLEAVKTEHPGLEDALRFIIGGVREQGSEEEEEVEE